MILQTSSPTALSCLLTKKNQKRGGKHMCRYLQLLFITLSLSGPVYAQGTTGTILGVVQDSSGAVIPGVSVTVKNLNTGITRTVTTDEGGRYTIPDLSLGSYEVEGQLPGFQTEVRSGIT